MANEKNFTPLVGTQLVQELIDRNLLPAGTTRCIIDSGNPGEAVKVYWAGFADVDLIKTLMDKLQETH